MTDDEIYQAAADMLAVDMLKILDEALCKPPTPEEMARTVIDGMGYDLTRVGNISATLIEGLLDISFAYTYPMPLEYIRINLAPPPSPLIVSTN